MQLKSMTFSYTAYKDFDIYNSGSYEKRNITANLARQRLDSHTSQAIISNPLTPIFLGGTVSQHTAHLLHDTLFLLFCLQSIQPRFPKKPHKAFKPTIKFNVHLQRLRLQIDLLDLEADVFEQTLHVVI